MKLSFAQAAPLTGTIVIPLAKDGGISLPEELAGAEAELRNDRLPQRETRMTTTLEQHDLQPVASEDRGERRPGEARPEDRDVVVVPARMRDEHFVLSVGARCVLDRHLRDRATRPRGPQRPTSARPPDTAWSGAASPLAVRIWPPAREKTRKKTTTSARLTKLSLTRG